MKLDILDRLPGGIPVTVRDVYVKVGHAEGLIGRRESVLGEKRKVKPTVGAQTFHKEW